MAPDVEKIPISAAEVEFEGLSFTDYNGRLFRWNGDLYRAIPPERCSFCLDLFNKGVMRALIEKGLFVQTELTPFELEGYPIVLKHRKIPFVSYPHEWADNMLKDAALYHLDFCLELDRHKLQSADAGPWNILFEATRPVFVDFGSIDRLSDEASPVVWPQSEPFRRFFINPLLLMAHGHHRIARWLLRDYEHGVEESELCLLTHPEQERVPSAVRLLARVKSRVQRALPSRVRLGVKKMVSDRRADRFTSAMRTREEFLQTLRSEVEDIALPPVGTSALEDTLPPYLSSERGQDELRRISTLMEELKPASILDLCSDDRAGYYARLLTRSGLPVVALRSDEHSVRELYAYASKNAVPLLTLRIAIGSPADDLSNTWFAPASKRLQCDAVLALGTLESWLGREPVRPESIVERLWEFTGRYLLVDSVRSEKIFAQHSPGGNTITASWYTLDNFIHLFQKRFKEVTLLSSFDTSHAFLFCRK